ncbi:hypothetical protein [Rhodanobacter sp. MP7CTX1]|uniref:hypothetical protein n=1 Tax=Rhodanobacter sp. MP7CTX1 TaxID=2723084 RepID=UPI0016165BAA|nr:hypothetical protein [Rhodanobacter sp. MP7CTX1]MBB6187939.1 hypothetical protein [Rhodanobacter sp. MP7CTX1]
MNVELLFTVAMLLALVVGFVKSAGTLRQRDLAIGGATFFHTLTERGFHGARGGTRTRAREIGRQGVHLLCTIIKLPGGSASGARGCAA